MTDTPKIMLDPDRLFPADPTTRSFAREIYETIRDLPIVSLHGHVDPALLAADEPFRSATQLLVTDDHYITRLMVSQGVPLDLFDWTRPAGREAAASDREVWREFCRRWPAFRATPSRLWLEYELVEILGVDERPSAESADRIFDAIAERLDDAAFRPRALFERFGIDVLATTDEPWSDLAYHDVLRDSGLRGAVIPTMRPDKLFEVAHADWTESVRKFEEAAGARIDDAEDLIAAIAIRREFFRSRGATATDHGSPTMEVRPMPAADVDRIFAAARAGAEVAAADADAFRAHMLFETARLAAQDGLVMQLHAGAIRDYDPRVSSVHGPDRGFDIPMWTDAANALRPLLGAFGFEERFRCVVYTLDESLWSRELAPLAGAYPALFLGAPWWFLDTPSAMRRHREAVTDTAGFYNTAGFVDDTRAFLSIPARHDTARRSDAAALAELVAAGLLPLAEAQELAIDLTSHIPTTVFRWKKEMDS